MEGAGKVCAICLESFERFASTKYYKPVEPCGHIGHLICYVTEPSPCCSLCSGKIPEGAANKSLSLSRCTVCLQELKNFKHFKLLDGCRHICHAKCFGDSMDCYFCKKEPDGNSLLCLLPDNILWIIASFIEDPDLVRLFRTCKRINRAFVDEHFWKLRCGEFEINYFVPDKCTWTFVSSWYVRYTNIGIFCKEHFTVTRCRAICLSDRSLSKGNKYRYHFHDAEGKMIWNRKEYVRNYPDRIPLGCVGHPIPIKSRRSRHGRLYKCKVCGKRNPGHYERKCPGPALTPLEDLFV